MKQTIALLLTLLLALSPAGCGKKKAPEGSGGPAPADAVVYDDSLIEEVLAEEGQFDVEGHPWPYAYYIPHLVGESAVIAEINRELDESAGALAQAELDAMAGGELFFYERIGYESHWEGSLLSLVVTAVDTDGEKSYMVLHYDFAADQRLDNKDLLARTGQSEEGFLRAARRAALSFFDEMGKSLPTEPWSLELFYRGDGEMPSALDRRMATWKAVMMETAMFYPEGGTWKYIAPILGDSPDGGRWYYEALELDFDPPTVDAVESDGVVTAALEQDRVFLSFSDSPETAGFLAAYRDNYYQDSLGTVVPGMEPALGPDNRYEVKGLWSHYTDIALLSGPEDYRPMLYLFTDRGTLEYVDVAMGLRYGVFCAMPMPGDFTGAKLSVELEHGEYRDYYAIIAAWPDGRRAEVGVWTSCASYAAPHGSWSGILEDIQTEYGSYSRIANWDFHDLGDLLITELDAAVAQGQASFYGLGMSEEGVICGYDYSAGDGGAIMAGALAYVYGAEATDGVYQDTLSLNVLSGVSPMGREGQWITLYPGVG